MPAVLQNFRNCLVKVNSSPFPVPGGIQELPIGVNSINCTLPTLLKQEISSMSGTAFSLV
uniref:Uncharacterized protein n=1 Tax=Arundo donax TaxID=35708 RepID=A0A0A9D8F4_ARUDO